MSAPPGLVHSKNRSTVNWYHFTRSDQCSRGTVNVICLPKVAPNLPKRVQTKSPLGALGVGPQVVKLEGGPVTPLPDQTRLDKDHKKKKKKYGDTVNHQTNLPPSRGVGYLYSFSRMPTSIYQYRNSPGNI